MMCPADMQPYIDAHEVELDEKDMYVYLASHRYGIEALAYTIDHALNGNKAKSKISDTSIREEAKAKQEAERPLTQEEIIEETKKYFRQRRIDKMNFDLMQLEKKKNQEGKVS